MSVSSNKGLKCFRVSPWGMNKPKYKVYAKSYKDARTEAGRLFFSAEEEPRSEKENLTVKIKETIRTLTQEEMANIHYENQLIVLETEKKRNLQVSNRSNWELLNDGRRIYIEPSIPQKSGSPELTAIRQIERNILLGDFSEETEQELDRLNKSLQELTVISEKVMTKKKEREDLLLTGIKMVTAGAGLAVAGYAAYKAFEHFWSD